jgi:hypothetical protein
MNKFAAGFTALLFVLYAAPSHAQQATRTWVSGVGDDVNPCSRTAPCKTFAGAISKTARDGEISVLDPGGYGAVTITKSITINGTPGAGYGSIVASLVNGVIINITDAADTRRTVRLNWLDINGIGTGLNGVRIVNSAASSVVIENTNIDGFTGRGISDERTSGGKLVVSNTTIRHTADSGIRIAAGGTNKIDATLSNVRVHNSAVAGLTANGGTKVMVSKSVFSGSTFGLDIEAGNTEATVDDSTISGNTTGIFQTGGAVVRLSNSNVSFNGTGVNGTVNSFSNNRFVANGAGGTITPIGGPSSPTGQQ